MKELFKDLDIFSESVQFNSSRQRLRKRTLIGAVLTTSIIVLTGIYFIYQSYLYFSGEVDPKFRQQTFVKSQVSIQLNNEMFGFDFFSMYSEYSYLNQIQADKNKTYIVFVPAYTFTNSTTSFSMPLDIIKCQSQELKGMSCIDVSKIPEQSLSIGNADKTFSLITIFAYRCQDTDQYKTFVPDNCADEESINEFINRSTYRLNIKIQTSQYNTTSQQMQTSYRNQVFQNSVNIVSGYEFKMQSQVTQVSQGMLIQSKKSYSSLISYQLATQTFDRKSIIKDTGCQYFSQIFIDADESVIHVNIQYPLFTEILALCNSTLALLLILGIFCRNMAQNLIRRDLLFILFRNFFSDTYLKILKHNNLIDYQNQTYQTEDKLKIKDDQSKQNSCEDQQETKHNVMPPCLTPKSNDRVFRLLLSQETDIEQQQQQQCDYVKEDITPQPKQINDSHEQDYENKIEKEISQNNQNQSYQQANGEDQNQKKIDKIQAKNFFNEQKIKSKFEDFGTAQNFVIQNEKFLFKSSFRGKSNEKQLSFRMKDSDDQLFQKQTLSPKLYQRSKKFNVSNTIEDQISQIKSSEKITTNLQDQRLKNLNDSSSKFKLEEILYSYKNFLAFFVSIFTQNKQNRLFKPKNFLESKGMKKQTFNQMEKFIDDSLDFFTFYKDILFIKKAIMILLNHEQLAMLQIIGMDIELIDPINSSLAEDASFSHFKEQFNVLQSQEKQQKYINKFFQKCQRQENLDKIDKRILSSLSKNQ